MCVGFCVLTANLFGFYFELLLVVIKIGLLNDSVSFSEKRRLAHPTVGQTSKSDHSRLISCNNECLRFQSAFWMKFNVLPVIPSGV